MSDSVQIREYEKNGERVFVIRNFIEVRIPSKLYESLIKRKSKEYINVGSIFNNFYRNTNKHDVEP